MMVHHALHHSDPGRVVLDLRLSAGLFAQFKLAEYPIHTLRGNANYQTMTWVPEVVDLSTQKVVSKQVGHAPIF